MAHIKKVDVKNYLASRKRNGFRPYRPANHPARAGARGESSAGANSVATEVIEKTFSQLTSSGLEMQANETRTDSGEIAIPAKSKGAGA